MRKEKIMGELIDLLASFKKNERGGFLSNLHKYLEKCFNSSNPIQAERAKILDSNIKNAQLFTAGLHLIDKGFVVKYSQPNYIELSINGKHEDELFEIQKSLLQSLEVISKFEIRANGDIVWILRPNPKP
jgi:uncharacterized protein with ATP-grasp and redox domains